MGIKLQWASSTSSFNNSSRSYPRGSHLPPVSAETSCSLFSSCLLVDTSVPVTNCSSHWDFCRGLCALMLHSAGNVSPVTSSEREFLLSGAESNCPRADWPKQVKRQRPRREMWPETHPDSKCLSPHKPCCWGTPAAARTSNGPWYGHNLEGTAYHSRCRHPNMREPDFRSIHIPEQCKNRVH